MKKFKEGDNLTLEDVRAALQEAHDKNINHASITESVNPSLKRCKDGSYEFDSIEEYRKAFDLVSVDEAFKRLGGDLTIEDD